MTIIAMIPHQIHGTARAVFHHLFPRRAYLRLTSEEWREEEIEMEILAALVDPDREAVDVGANVGHYSVRLSRLVQKVHAFEPHPRLARILKRCLPTNVVVYQEAVSDEAGVVVLLVPTFRRPVEGMASLSADNEVFATARRLTRHRVRSKNLDELARENIGFVKIDVEGHEIRVLTGASRLIEQQRPVFLIEVEERHKVGAVSEVFQYFRSREYIGIFIWKRQIFPLQQFTVDMQKSSLIIEDAPRKSYDYVNNFIFLPKENWSDARQERVSDLLRSADRKTDGEPTASVQQP